MVTPETVRAVVDQMPGKRTEAVKVDRAVACERRDDRGEDLTEHTRNSTRSLGRVIFA